MASIRLACALVLACGGTPTAETTPVQEPVQVQTQIEPDQEPLPEPAPAMPAADVARGDAEFSATGTLEEGDTQHPNDSSFYDAYTAFAQQGDRIEVTMESNDFDCYLQMRLQDVDDNEFLNENDDIVAGNTDSHLDVVAPRDGVYVIWANSLTAGETGAYTLHIRVHLPE